MNRMSLVPYLYKALNKIGTYSGYLAVVAIAGQTEHFLLNLSFLFAARFAGNSLLLKFAPPLINKFGLKKCLILGNALAGVLMVLLLFSKGNIAISSFLLILLGAMDHLEETSFELYTSKCIEHASLAKFNQNLESITILAMIIGASIGGALIQFSGVDKAILFSAAPFFVGASVAMFFRDCRIQSTVKNAGEKSFSCVLMQQSPEVFRSLGVSIIATVITAAFNLLEIPYYLKGINLDYAQIGPFLTVTMIGLCGASTIVKKLPFEKSNMHHLILLLVMLMTSFILLSFTQKQWLAAIFLLSFIVFSNLINALVRYNLQKMIKVSDRSVVLSCKSSLSRFITLLITLAAGIAADTFGLSFTFQFFFYCALLLVVPYLTFRQINLRRAKHRSSPELSLFCLRTASRR